MSVPTARVLRFGDFELDVRAGELRKHGLRIRLPDQSFQILLLLLEQPGEVVLREDIRLKLWPNNTIVEFDHSINAAIKRLRGALGESAENPRFIETLAKRGYRFDGQVLDNSPDPAEPEAAPAGETGHYRLLEKLGEGGMGVVYRAQDLKLGRMVAVKFLPFEDGELPESVRRRFEREARTASALNHPNICTIYGLEDFDGKPAIVMELVEGETLAARLSRGRLPLDEALRVAVEVAGALAEAHRAGITHRDLKPANIMLTKPGLSGNIVKVLDFGLAKTERPIAVADSPATEGGTILGTLHYMSPEQIEGAKVDARSDIFSFGLVLYEMLSGRRAFEGNSAASVMAGILERAPVPPADLPPNLVRLLDRCLVKDPEQRWQSARDLQAELAWIAESAPESGIIARLAARRSISWQLIAGGVIAVLLIALGITFLRDKPVEPPPARFDVSAPDGAEFGGVPGVAVSPDGRRFLFATTWKQRYQLWVRTLDSPAPVTLLGPEGAMMEAAPAFWSPDGRSIAYFGDVKLKRIDLDRPGGPGEPVTLCRATFARGGSWNRDGVIIFSSGNGLISKIPDTGGTPTPVTRFDESRQEGLHAWPFFLPDGRHFLFAAFAPPGQDSTIRIGSLDSPGSSILLDADSNAIFARGNLLYLKDDILMAQPFDLRKLAVTGGPMPVAEHMAAFGGLAPFSAAESGPLVYSGGRSDPPYELVWFDREGNRLSTLGEPWSAPAAQYSPYFSPDQKRVALSIRDEHNTNIFFVDVASGARTRLTFGQGADLAPVWSPDGRSIVFSSNRHGRADLFRKSLDSAGDEQLLYSDSADKFPTSWSRDGKYLLFDRLSDTKPRMSVWALPLSPGAQKAFPLNLSSEGEASAQFSPDGEWITYSEVAQQQWYLDIAPFHPGSGSSGSKVQTPGPFTAEGRWSKDSRELFFRSGRTLMMVPVHLKSGAVEIGEPRQVIGSSTVMGYDVAADGKLLVALRRRQDSSRPLTVFENWTSVLKK
jgi:eukaryotic-like serine/threonine-protein kinase